MFGLLGRNLMVQQNWIPSVQGIAMRKILVSVQWKLSDWLCISGGIFCRGFKSAFIVSEQTFWRIFFSKSRNFYHHFCSSVNIFTTWQVKNGGFIKSDFLKSVVSLEKFFIFQIDVFPIDSVLLSEKFRQGFWNWFLRIFGAALTKSTVFAKLTFVWPVWVSSIKIGVWCSSFYHLETMSQRITFFWAENLQQVYQLGNLRVQTKSLIKIWLWKKLQSFINFGLWEKNSDYRWKNFDSVVETTY